MATDKNLQNLVLNNVESQRVFDYMKDNNLINDDELYLVGGSLTTPFVTPQMYNAKGNGTTDDTAAIQAALDASSYVYIPDGIYMINATISIKPKSNQTIILSNNATLKAIDNSTGDYNILNIFNVENVYIQGGKIQGYKDNLSVDTNGTELGYGINIVASENIIIEQLEVLNCWGDSMFIGLDRATGVNSCNIKILNCQLHDHRRRGVSLVGCTDVSIRDCEFGFIGSTADAIYIEPDQNGVVKNITIDNCNILDDAIRIEDSNSTNEIKGINIINTTVPVCWFSAGEDVYFNNCNINIVGIGTITPARFVNSKVGRIFLKGGIGVFDNCDIVNESGYMIVSGTDGYPNRKSSLYCSNCRFGLNNTLSDTQFLVTTQKGDTTNGHPTKDIVFDNCLITLSGKSGLISHWDFEKLRIENCKIACNRDDLYSLLVIDSDLPSSAILKNTEFIYQGTLSYLFETGAIPELDLTIVSCKFPDIQNFIGGYSSDFNGRIRMFDSAISNTNVVGAPNIELFISNDIDTTVTENSNNLITSGAVEEALKGLTLGVHTDGLVYLFKNGVPVGSGLEITANEVGGDVIGTLDENNNILLSGNIADGTYTLKWLKDDGTYADAGNLIVSSITEYAINTTLSNCSASGATSIRSNGSATVTISASSGYTLPDSVTVSGASYTWDKATGNIILSNPTSDVYITVTANKAITNFIEYNTDNTTDWSIWCNDARVGSDGGYRSSTSQDVTNYIAVQNGDIIYINNGRLINGQAIGFYGASKKCIESNTTTQLATNGHISDATKLNSATLDAQFTITNTSVAFIRFTLNRKDFLTVTDDDIVVNIKRNGEWL